MNINFTANINKKLIRQNNEPPCVNPYLKQKKQKDSFEKTGIEPSEEMKNRFDGLDLAKLTASPQKYKNAEILSKTKLEPKNIASNLIYFLDEDFNAEKFSQNVLNLQNECGENLDKIEFSRNNYNDNEISLEATLKNGDKKVEVYNKSLEKEFNEEIQQQKIGNINYEIRKSKDFRNNTISKTRSIVKDGWYTPVNEIIIKKDEKGNTLYKETSEQSEIKGIMNTKRVYSDGTVKNISVGKINQNNGIITIKKDFDSPDGTHTKYRYLDDPQGNKIVEYEITDKNGNKLMNKKQFFDVISDNKFISSKNGKDYEITVDKNELNIKNMKTQDNTKINLNTYLMNNEKTLLNLLKQVDGEELIQMKDNVTRLFMDNGSEGLSNYHPARKDVTTSDNLYTMLHEFGHAKDMKNYDITTLKTKDATKLTKISADKDVLEIYHKEKDNFNKNFPDNQRKHINYFINSVHKDGKDGSFTEALAEVNALLNTYTSIDRFSMRGQYLQANFPKTIAILAQKLNA